MEKEKLFALNEEAARFFEQSLPGSAGERYLTEKRHLTPETIKKFRLGFAPDSWQALHDHFQKLGVPDEELYEAGLLGKSYKTGRYYDAFRNRAVFPIRTAEGIVGFSGRTLSADKKTPKYYNSRETEVFHKKDVLFGMEEAKQSSLPNMILCEGYLDVISLHQAGLDSAVAPMGTAFTESQQAQIEQTGKPLVLFGDSDGPGREAVDREIDMLGHYPTRIVQYSRDVDGKDPDEFLQKRGLHAVQERIRTAQTPLEYKFWQIEEKSPLIRGDQGFDRYLDFARKEQALIGTMATNPSEVDKFAGILSDLSHTYSVYPVSQDAIEKSIRTQAEKADNTDLLRFYRPETPSIPNPATDSAIPSPMEELPEVASHFARLSHEFYPAAFEKNFRTGEEACVAQVERAFASYNDAYFRKMQHGLTVMADRTTDPYLREEIRDVADQLADCYHDQVFCHPLMAEARVAEEQKEEQEEQPISRSDTVTEIPATDLPQPPDDIQTEEEPIPDSEWDDVPPPPDDRDLPPESPEYPEENRAEIPPIDRAVLAAGAAGIAMTVPAAEPVPTESAERKGKLSLREQIAQVEKQFAARSGNSGLPQVGEQPR